MAPDPTEADAAPAIILVTPQLGENIGAAARAMLNCGLTDLRLVAPRDGWPNSAADRAAVGALDLMPPVRVFDQLTEAMADLTMVYATTARDRNMVKPIVTARQAALEARVHLAAGGKVGFLFGPERTGLLSDDVSLANKLITVPLNPAFTSLNLGQAVLLIGYEWFQSGDATPRLAGARSTARGRRPRRSCRTSSRIWRASSMPAASCATWKPGRSMVRNLRSMWQRAELTEQEVRTLHGMIKELTTLRVSRRKSRAT